MDRLGRICPLHYRYRPAVLARPPELCADTLLIAGGLYGNLPAFDALERLLEPQGVLIFNGDFNWFNVDAPAYAAVNRAVLQHTALRGNVETELYGDGSDAGCGCAYPESVADSEVENSNAIMARLREVAARAPTPGPRLDQLPMHLVAQVGELRIGIVHGDAQSLAGWDFSHDHLHDPTRTTALLDVFNEAQVDVFASSHTCLPALREFHSYGRRHVVINNGAAGMPNFAGTGFGVATRISSRPCPATIHLYGTRLGSVFVDAVKVPYDRARFVEQFLSNWPAGSAAHESYYSRIMNGPAFTTQMALSHLPGQQQTGKLVGQQQLQASGSKP